jgi:uncharacterized membrane protein YphA (DoxX/SURF4 family)
MSADSFAKNSLAPLILRLALAAVFIYHGVDKVLATGSDWGATWATNVWRQKAEIPVDVKEKMDRIVQKEANPEEKAKIREVEQQLANLYRRDVQPPPAALEQHWAQLAVAWGEFLGGILLLFGFGSRLAALWLIVIQAGAIYTVTGMKGFSVAEGGGYEYNVVLLAMCLAMLCLGSGPLSLSRYLSARRQRSRAAARPPEPVNV